MTTGTRTKTTTTENPPVTGDRMPTRDDRMPTIGGARDCFEVEGGVVGPAEKRRAAIVYLLSENQQGRRTDLTSGDDPEKSSLASYAEMASWGWKGLKDPGTVSYYHNWYKKALKAGKADRVEWGGPYREPTMEWTFQKKAGAKKTEKVEDPPFIQGSKIITSATEKILTLTKVAGLSEGQCQTLDEMLTEGPEAAIVRAREDLKTTAPRRQRPARKMAATTDPFEQANDLLCAAAKKILAVIDVEGLDDRDNADLEEPLTALEECIADVRDSFGRTDHRRRAGIKGQAD